MFQKSVEKLAEQHIKLTTLSGCEVNGTAESVVAGEESESAFLLDVFTTISAQLNSLLTWDGEYKKHYRNPSQCNSILAQIARLACFQKEQTS